MIVVVLALLVVVVGLAVAVAIGRIPVSGMAEPTGTSPFEGLPAGPVTDDAIDGLRFDQTLRGYRMTQVDATIDRLRDELLQRDHEIARLRADRPAAEPGVPAYADPQHATHRDLADAAPATAPDPDAP